MSENFKIELDAIINKKVDDILDTAYGGKGKREKVHMKFLTEVTNKEDKKKKEEEEEEKVVTEEDILESVAFARISTELPEGCPIKIEDILEIKDRSFKHAEAIEKATKGQLDWFWPVYAYIECDRDLYNSVFNFCNRYSTCVTNTSIKLMHAYINSQKEAQDNTILDKLKAMLETDQRTVIIDRIVEYLVHIQYEICNTVNISSVSGSIFHSCDATCMHFKGDSDKDEEEDEEEEEEEEEPEAKRQKIE